VPTGPRNATFGCFTSLPVVIAREFGEGTLRRSTIWGSADYSMKKPGVKLDHSELQRDVCRLTRRREVGDGSMAFAYHALESPLHCGIAKYITNRQDNAFPGSSGMLYLKRRHQSRSSSTYQHIIHRHEKEVRCRTQKPNCGMHISQKTPETGTGETKQLLSTERTDKKTKTSERHDLQIRTQNLAAHAQDAVRKHSRIALCIRGSRNGRALREK
jgi:hypothetical protein